jgi:hypothetical protein
MNVLKATNEQKEQLEGFYANGACLRFIKDAFDNNVVNEAVLYDDSFLDIREILQTLPVIEFIPQIIQPQI